MDSGLTIVIPVWDRYVPLLAPLLKQLRQEPAVTDIVVVDNASVIPVGEVPAARVIRLDQRLTVGAARNVGLRQVRTAAIAFLDADDLPYAGALSRLVTEILVPGVVAAAGAVVAWHPDVPDTELMPFPPATALRVQRRPRILATYAVARHAYPIVGACVMSTAAVRDAGGFGDGDFCEDWSLAASLAWRGRIKLHRWPALLVRFHAGSEITRVGTPRNIARQVPVLHRRWRADPRIPSGVKMLLPLLGLRRLWTALKRARSGEIAHDDVLDRMGRPTLSTGPTATPTAQAATADVTTRRTPLAVRARPDG